MPEPILTFTPEFRADLVVLRFAGRMDAEGVREVSEDVDRATVGSTPVLVDLTAATFLESLGVALLVRIAKRQRQKGSSVAIVPGSAAARILGAARVDRILNVAFTEADALQLLGLA